MDKYREWPLGIPPKELQRKELDEVREDYSDAIALIEEAGFILVEKTNSEIYNREKFSSTFNHIFKRM